MLAHIEMPGLDLVEVQRVTKTERHPVPALAAAFPLLVELRTFADLRWPEHTFLDLIDHLHRTGNPGMSRAVLKPYLRQGGLALVVFDGLDEIFDTAVREQVTRQIEAFADRYPQLRVIVTPRVVGYRRATLDAAGFSHWMLQWQIRLVAGTMGG